MGQIGLWQILIVAVLVVLLFGRGKIPHLMGDLAQGIKSFKRGMKEDDAAKAKTIDAKVETEVETETETVSSKDKAASQG